MQKPFSSCGLGTVPQEQSISSRTLVEYLCNPKKKTTQNGFEKPLERLIN